MRKTPVPPQWPALLLVAAFLAGCAGQRAHREGLELMESGRLEEGLAKLEQAAREAPDDKSFRTDFITKREQVINRMLLAADNERTIGRPDEAEVLYERVLKLDRENFRAKAGLEAVAMDRRHAQAFGQARDLFAKGDLEGAQARLQAILLENPKHGEAKALQRQIEEQRVKYALETPALQSRFKKPVTLQFRDANLKMVFEALSRTSGINVLLDKDIKPDLKTTIFVKDVSVEDTIDLILMQNQLEKKVLSENTVFVYPNTPAKIKEYQDLKIRSFHLVNADAKQMLTMIKTVLKTRDLFLDEKTNSLVMRDTPDAIRLAEKLVAAQDLTEPEVVMEVEVLEVKRSRLTQLGIKFPDQVTFSVTETPAVQTSTVAPGGAIVTTTTPAQPLTVEGLRNLNGSAIRVTPINVTLDLKKEDGDTNLLASPRIRARNKEKAKILVGDRVPVITNTVTPVATGTPVVTGNVQYLDVGLKLEVEPNVHPDSDVAIKINLEVSSIVREVTGSAGTLAYQIGTRTASTLLRLKDGETQVLAGLINDEDRKAAQKVPGLGDLPVLGRLFSTHRDTTDKTEIILSITPHVIRPSPRPDAQLVEFWSGTEATLRSRPLSLQPVGMVTMGTPAATAPRPAPQARPPVLPGAGQPAAPQPVALSWQGPAQAKVGEQFKLSLEAQSGQEANSFPLRIGFDPTVLKAVEVTEGEFLKQSNLQSIFSSSIDPAGGQISAELSSAGAVGATGKGSLVTVTFEVIAAKPQAQITLLGTAPAGAGGKALPYAPPAPHTINLVP